MAIRSRVVTLHRDAQVPADQTAIVLGAVVLPKTGKIKSVKGWIFAKTGDNAAQLDVLKSGAAGSSGAASTTSVLSAVMDMTSDAIVTGTLSATLSAIHFIAGEVLYLKATTGGTTTMDRITVTIEVDY